MALAISGGTAPGMLDRFLLVPPAAVNEIPSVFPVSTQRFCSLGFPEPASVNLSKKNVIDFSSLWKDPADLCMGAQALFFVFTLYAFAHGGLSLCGLIDNPSDTGVGWADHENNVFRQWIIDSISLVALTADMANWADKKKIIGLAEGALYCKLMSSWAWCIAYGIQAYGSYNEIVQQLGQFGAVKEEDRAQLEKQYLLSRLSLVGYSTGVFWALFTLASLVPGLEIASALATGALCISGVFTVSCSVCKIISINGCRK